MTADGAALGLSAFGLTDEAGALGLIRFGPVAAGAEPGIGTKTPWAVAACPRVRAARAAARANKCLEIGGMAPTCRGPSWLGLLRLEARPRARSEWAHPDRAANIRCRCCA